MRDALEALPCVRKAEVSFETLQAKVTVENAKYKPEALSKALVAAGFGGKLAKEKEGTPAPKAKVPDGLRVTFHVMGMLKTKSGAT